MAEGTTTVRLENKAPHVKHISLPGGQSIAVPPQEVAGAVTTVNLESDEERESFRKAIASGPVRQWIDAGELVVHGAGEEPKPISPAEQVERSQRDKTAADKAAAAEKAETAAEKAESQARDAFSGQPQTAATSGSKKHAKE